MNTAPYAPDNLATFAYSGDTLVRSLEDKTTLFTANDIQQGVGGSGVADLFKTMQDNFSDVQQSFVDASNKNGTTEQAINPATDDCSQYPVGSNNWMYCKGKSIGTSISGNVLKPVTDILDRSLFGLLGVLVVGFGLYYFAQD
jgi:hypothetical protein